MILNKINWNKPDTEYVPDGYMNIQINWKTGYTGWHLVGTY
jgi:hypothetical protein